VMKSAIDTHGTTNAHTSATTYSASEIYPFRSSPIARASWESVSCRASSTIVRIV
jgi:hypothetical protein